MPLGASRINGISKVIVVAAANVVRRKLGPAALGNAQIDTAQSKFGGSSLLLDGNDYIQIIPSSASDFAIGTGDFTIECWVRFASTSAGMIIDSRGSPQNGGGWCLYINTNTIRWYYNFGDRITSGTISTNTWYHVALVRSGNDHKLYIDGTQSGSTYTAANTYVIGTSTYGVWIGDNQPFPGNGINGHVDEFRVSNTARYTAGFTPSTTAFVNDDNTVMLLHMNGTDASTFIEDDNGIRDSRDLRAIGNAQIDTAQSKFGGSSYLGDGTGDYLISNANSAYDFGTSSFTIEFWVRFASVGTLQVPTALREGAGIENGNWWCEVTATEKKMYWGFKNQAGTQYYINLALAGTAFVANTWYHIALVNNAGTAQMYIDGTATGVTTSLSGSFGTNGTQLWIGAGAGAYSLNGHIDEYRISNTARYTANFTPSTTPFTNDANTRILVHFDGTDASTVFRDDNGDGRSPKNILPVANAQIDTAQSKFGGAAALFDGTGDYLQVDPPIALGTGNFTVECWIRRDDTITDHIIVDFRDTGTQVAGTLYASNQTLIWYVNGAARITTGNVLTSTSVFYHVAVSRSGSDTKLFVDGTQQGSTYTDTNNYLGPKTTIGAAFSTGSSDYDGWIDEFRISSTARYTGNFTPTTTAFQNDANTLLLLHMDGTDAATVFIDDNGDTQV